MCSSHPHGALAPSSQLLLLGPGPALAQPLQPPSKRTNEWDPSLSFSSSLHPLKLRKLNCTCVYTHTHTTPTRLRAHDIDAEIVYFTCFPGTSDTETLRTLRSPRTGWGGPIWRSPLGIFPFFRGEGLFFFLSCKTAMLDSFAKRVI